MNLGASNFNFFFFSGFSFVGSSTVTKSGCWKRFNNSGKKIGFFLIIKISFHRLAITNNFRKYLIISNFKSLFFLKDFFFSKNLIKKPKDKKEKFLGFFLETFRKFTNNKLLGLKFHIKW